MTRLTLASPEALDTLHERLGGITVPEHMHGDNLAILLCSFFEDGEGEENDNGWTDAAIAGQDAVLGAIRAHYDPTLRALAAERDALRDRAERAEAQLATAREGFKDVLGMLDDPTGGEHERDMRGASIIARKHLALLDHPAPAPSPEAVARAALEWQPIDTAPGVDGGLHIRGMWVYSAMSRKPLYWTADYGYVDEDGDFIFASGDDTGWEASSYTHWRHLPHPPATEQKAFAASEL